MMNNHINGKPEWKRLTKLLKTPVMSRSRHVKEEMLKKMSRSKTEWKEEKVQTILSLNCWREGDVDGAWNGRALSTEEEKKQLLRGKNDVFH